MALAAGGLQWEDVKAEIATVVANGVCADDARVLPRFNEATRILLSKLVPVGGMATYDVVAQGTTLLLPKQIENAIEVEVLNDAQVRNQVDVTQGWQLVTNSTYIDPSNAHDSPLVDLFLHPDPQDPSIRRRKYDFPGLQSGATVRVTGKKQYVPITGDDDYLIIQNIPAVKLEILAREYLERGAQYADDARKYHQMAVEDLQEEVRTHMLDPTNSMKRKAAYQKDLIDFAEGTLGRTRARLALELPGLMAKGKSEITYLVNRAVQMLVDNRNQLAIAGRISVHGTTDEIAYVPTNVAATALPWGDFNQIRLMAQSFMSESGEPQALAVAEEYQKKAFELQRAQLIEATEKARHGAYTSALSEFPDGTHGHAVARLALEMPGGLALTETELDRLVGTAEKRIMEKGKYKGTLKTLSGTIHGGEILFPRDVEAVLVADICGYSTDLRNIFFEYQRNGPGHCFECEGRFVDAGEVYFADTASKRRKYIYRGNCEQDVSFSAVAKIRYVVKENCDPLVIKNFPALLLYAQGIKYEREEKWKEAQVAQADSISILEAELQEYLSGLQHSQNVDTEAFGFAGLGEML
jgi:hypothetical protein